VPGDVPVCGPASFRWGVGGRRTARKLRQSAPREILREMRRGDVVGFAAAASARGRATLGCQPAPHRRFGRHDESMNKLGKSKRYTPLEAGCLAAVLALAIAARAYRLEASLWFDEIVTLVEFVRLPLRELVSTFSLNNHLFFSLQAKAAIAVFTESVWALRLPAAAFGIASLVAWWLLARRIVGPTEAMVTAALLAVSYHHVWFSQNARGYTGLLFWTTVASWLFAEGLARSRRRTWAAYALAAAAAMYTHLSASFFLAAHGFVYAGAWLLWRFAPQTAGARPGLAGAATVLPLVGMAAAGALALLLHGPILAQVPGMVGTVASGAANPGSGLAEWLQPARALREVVAAFGGAGGLMPLVLAAGFLLLAVGTGSLARRQPVLTAVYVVSVPLALAILLAVRFRIWPRYFFVDIGFVYLAVVHGSFIVGRRVGYLLARGRTARWLADVPVVVLVLAMTVGSLVMLVRNYRIPKQDFAGAAAYVERQRGAGDAVAAVGLARYAFGRYYAPAWLGADTPEELTALRARAPSLWVVVAFPHQTALSRPAIDELLRAQFERVAVFPGTLGDGAILVYRSR
jgi:hypothetical protein